VKTRWVVGEFVDFMKMWVNLFHLCWRWVKLVFLTHFLFQICRLHPLPFSVSSIWRLHLLVIFLFTHLFFPFHQLVHFTYLQIASTCTCFVLWLALSVIAYTTRPFLYTNVAQGKGSRRQKSIFTMLCALVSPTCRFKLLVDFTHLQISLTCRFHLISDFIYLHLFCWLMSLKSIQYDNISA